jgi:hypothetical protein
VADEDCRRLVTDALATVGFHRYVPFDITRVDVGVAELRIELTLQYRCAHRVCCGVPACYTPFLGLKRAEVPLAVARALDLDAVPAVSIVVHLRHETGYEHLSIGSAEDTTIEYDASHFA